MEKNRGGGPSTELKPNASPQGLLGYKKASLIPLMSSSVGIHLCVLVAIFNVTHAGLTMVVDMFQIFLGIIATTGKQDFPIH